MPVPSTNGNHPNGDRSERGPSIAELITEAEALRNVLLDATSRLARVLAGLKQHRRQSRAMQAAMHSLKQLQLDR
jgi:hypothetical protein